MVTRNRYHSYMRVRNVEKPADYNETIKRARLLREEMERRSGEPAHATNVPSPESENNRLIAESESVLIKK